MLTDSLRLWPFLTANGEPISYSNFLVLELRDARFVGHKPADRFGGDPPSVVVNVSIMDRFLTKFEMSSVCHGPYFCS